MTDATYSKVEPPTREQTDRFVTLAVINRADSVQVRLFYDAQTHMIWRVSIISGLVDEWSTTQLP